MFVRFVMAATVAVSVFSSTNQVDATAAASVLKAEQAVVKAEKLGTALRWETAFEYRKAKYPNNPVGYPDMKLFNDTKKALVVARNAVAPIRGKDKEILSARLDANVSLYVNRTAAYIDAVTSGLKIQKKTNELKTLSEKGIVDDRTDKLYYELNAEIKKNSSMLDRVYGETTRSQFRAIYKQPAVNLVNQLFYPITIKAEIDKTNAALKAGGVDEAAQHLGNVDFFLKEASKNGQTEKDKLLAGSLTKQKATQAEFNKHWLLFTAKQSPTPTSFGPNYGSEAINKTVYVYTGANEQIILQNQSIGGRLVILGSPSGTGSVTMNHTEVNRVEFKAATQVIISQGSKVKEMTKDPSVIGTVRITNKGTIEKADGTLLISGNAPGQPGTNSGVVSKFDSFSVKAYIGPNLVTYPGSYNQTTNTGTISLADYSGDIDFVGLEIKAASTAMFRVTYINTEKSHPVPRNVPFDFMVWGGSVLIRTNDLWPGGGFKDFKGYRQNSGKYLIIKGNLIDSNNNESQEITIQVNF